ncbi:MAG: pitrilysin family protein [Oscillospiraceae bacterium]
MQEVFTLENGVRILTEKMEGVRSAALGIFIATGSRDEAPGENGAAHFIEHMTFKGTEKRTAQQIAVETDAIGGQMNAYTTKDSTCFYTRTLDTHLAQATDILCDMLLASKFDEGDVATERGVILEEIGMYEDNPEDLCSERLAAAVYKGNPLARPILGRKSTLNAMTGDFLRDYQRRHYTPDRIVVSLAGSFSAENVADLKNRFSVLTPGAAPKRKSAVYTPADTVKKRTIEQNHLTIAFKGLPYGDEKRFTLQLLSFLLGGGMSSRLWQEVREKRGLCYSLYTYGAAHQDTGMFAIYTALGKNQEGEALRAIMDTVRDFTAKGVTDEELNMAREQSKANVLMGLESTQARMSHMGRSVLVSGEIMTPDQLIAAYDSVTAADIQTLSKEIFNLETASISAVGRVGDAAYYRALLG